MPDISRKTRCLQRFINKRTENTIMSYEQSLLFTPEGVRDIYGIECEKRRKIEADIHKIMKSYGFKTFRRQLTNFSIFSTGNVELLLRKICLNFSTNTITHWRFVRTSRRRSRAALLNIMNRKRCRSACLIVEAPLSTAADIRVKCLKFHRLVRN